MFFHFHIANFFRFIAAYLSFTHFVTCLPLPVAAGRKHDHNDTFYNSRYQDEFKVFLWKYRDLILLEEMFYARMIEIVVDLSYIVLLLFIFFESR